MLAGNKRHKDIKRCREILDAELSCGEPGLLEKGQYWCKLKSEQGTVFFIENDKIKLCWDFEYRMRKETTARRPDVTIEYKDRKLIQIIDMAGSSDQNINEKVKEKL